MSTSKEEIAQARIRMEKAVEDLRRELATIRTGRASISILDSIQVDYYGVPTPVNQVAQLGTPDATLITVQPYDVSLVGPVEKAIRASDLGLNPSNDGRLIRIPIPPLTEERRKTLAKHVHKVLEDHSYGFKGRLVWKQFVSPEDCQDEYRRWRATLSKEPPK